MRHPLYVSVWRVSSGIIPHNRAVHIIGQSGQWATANEWQVSVGQRPLRPSRRRRAASLSGKLTLQPQSGLSAVTDCMSPPHLNSLMLCAWPTINRAMLLGLAPWIEAWPSSTKNATGRAFSEPAYGCCFTALASDGTLGLFSFLYAVLCPLLS